MPRDGSNVYTLPEAPFAANTTATAATVNSNFSDLADELSDSVCRSSETTAFTRTLLNDASAADARTTLEFSAAASTAVTLASAMVIDRAYAEYTSATGLGTRTPIDDSVPQVGEGTEILSASITPKSTSSRLRVRFSGCASSNTGTTWLIVHAHVNGASSATAARAVYAGTAGAQVPLDFEFEYAPSSTSAQAITIRAGADSGSVYFNGNASTPSRYLGGTQRATLVIEELL